MQQKVKSRLQIFVVKKIKEEVILNLCRQETIQEYDFDKDGKLNTAEYHQVGRGTQKWMFIFFFLLPQVMEQVGIKYLVGGYNFNR